NDRVAVFGAEDHSFTSLQDAEAVLSELQDIAPELFNGASIAVFEVSERRTPPDEGTVAEHDISLDTMLRALSDFSVTEGRSIVLVGEQYQAEKSNMENLFAREMHMQVTRCDTAREAIPILEDNLPDLIITDLELPDMHGWTFIQKVREIRSLADLCIFVMSDNPADEVFALKVARVQGFLPRPVNMRKLRQRVWLLIEQNMPATSTTD
ncbi:MAG: response regulator, partial [Chloroflexota bacterium]